MSKERSENQEVVIIDIPLELDVTAFAAPPSVHEDDDYFLGFSAGIPGFEPEPHEDARGVSD